MNEAPSTQTNTGVHLLGIRHHGPGSARAVGAALEALKPDIVLIEGPPEADELLKWVADREMKPPVAILCFRPDDPGSSVYYPFVEFSPEWQAISFAMRNQVPARFMDLPISNQLAVEEARRKEDSPEITPSNESLAEEVKRDPLAYLAEIAGMDDGEKWWEEMIEYRQNSEDVFEAVSEMMQSLREQFPSRNKLEEYREAHMRKMIRQAQREMYTNIAVVCGAWHVPALINMPKQKEDNELLKGLPKVKTECTWIPWTYDRLSFSSGYGAGIHSPGWYEHIWNYPQDDGTRWMSRVASLFREEGMDTSVAHVIEAVRLAETLAALRGKSKSGLEELSEATLSVLCNGEPAMMELIHRKLIVSDRLGEVPTEVPRPPLQIDLEKWQKSLRIQPIAGYKDYTLDLRKEMDLARSVLLHRLIILGIEWGMLTVASGKGTFKEQWRLEWIPEFSVRLIEKGSWGNTVEEAANSFLVHSTSTSTSINQIAAALETALPAELHAAVETLIRKLNDLSAASSDVLQLIGPVPALVRVARYGNVRKTDSELVLQILRSMIARICIGLPNATIGINDEAAEELVRPVSEINNAVSLLQEEELTHAWQKALTAIAEADNSAMILGGYSTRLLADRTVLSGDELSRLFHFRMSLAPEQSASWLEGFLKGSGSILLLDENLWRLVNEWVESVNPETFIGILPLLRRTFADFTPPEKRKIGEKVRSGKSSRVAIVDNTINISRARKGIPVVMELLGIKNKNHGG
jgi:hypothetical protein